MAYRSPKLYRRVISTYIALWRDLHWVVGPRRDKSCGRVADKFGLRAWTINLRTWIFGLTCLVFKTTYIDRGKPLREGAFFFTGMTLSPPLDKRNTHDKAKGKAYHFGGVYRGAGRTMP